MDLLLKHAHLVDPASDLDAIGDIAIDDGKIVDVGEDLGNDADEVRDMSGHVIVPGLVDIHVHLRDPGQEYKEDIHTGTQAAAHGGFTGVCSMPNTVPACDNADVIDYIKMKAETEGACRVWPSGTCTKGRAGEALSEMGDMVAHGAVAFTDDGNGVQDAGMMRRVMDYAVQFGKVVMSHCQDEELVGAGQVNEGAASTRLGMSGWPGTGEELQISRDIQIGELTGCPLHIQHLTTARALEMLRLAKAHGCNVTCEVTPHHLFLDEDCITETYDTNFKVNPPLRTAQDRKALIEGVVDGTVDCIVTDHAPHSASEKSREFELAPFGMTGIETSVPSIVSNLVNPGIISWSRMVELMSINPRRIIGVEQVRLAPGNTADLTVIDPTREYTALPENMYSKSKNSGFLGMTFTGCATDVYVDGKATMKEGIVVE